MSLLWSNNDERNYICIIKIVTDIVSEGLRTIFKQEWNNRYQATLGAWDDTPFSGQALFNLERGRSRAKMYLPKFQNGNTKEWDCTLLFDAILYSKSIGLSGLNPSIKKEVDILRKLRNEILHMRQGQLAEHKFEVAWETARKSFQALGLSTKEIDNIKIERKRVSSFQVLPPQPTHEVMQRSEQVSAIIDDLDKLSTSNDGKLTYFYISGNPGSGKSQLARQIGESHYNAEIDKQSGLTFVMTLIAQSLDTLLESCDDFARRLNCAENVVANIINSEETKEVKIRHLRSQIATRIRSYKSWLIIVDDVENLALVSPLLPQLSDEDWNGGQVLVTTQETSNVPPNGSFTKHVSVRSGMGVTESCHLLATLSGTGDAEDPMLAEVANRLDYQPLAMAAASVYLNQVIANKVSPKFSWRNYLEKLDVGERQLTEEQLLGINPAYSLTMTTAVVLAVEKSAETDVVLNHTFNFLSLSSFESLPLDVVINYVLLVTKDQDKEQVGIKIQNSSLILSEDGEDISIRLHPLVHTAFKVCSGRNEDKEIITSGLDAASRSFYMFKDRKDGETLVPHLKAFHIAMTTNTLQAKKTLYLENPRSEISKMFFYFGSLLHHYGEFLFSKEFLTAALDICMELNGPDHITAASLYSHLGSVHQELGDLQQANQYHERALDICIKQLGSNHMNVAASYNNLGIVHQALGDLQQAKQYHERARDILIKQLGSNHVHVGCSYNNLGSVHQALGDLQQAKQYHERALDIRIQLLGSNHVSVAASYDNLRIVHQDLGDLQQANQYYERALDIRTQRLGSNYVNVAASKMDPFCWTVGCGEKPFSSRPVLRSDYKTFDDLETHSIASTETEDSGYSGSVIMDEELEIEVESKHESDSSKESFDKFQISEIPVLSDGDTEIRLEESTISDQKDDKCWFTEKFLDPELCLLKEEICQKLESFPWLSGAYGITGPNKKIQHPHLYVTVKRGISKSKVRSGIEEKLGANTIQYVELLQERKKPPTIKFMSGRREGWRLESNERSRFMHQTTPGGGISVEKNLNDDISNWSVYNPLQTIEQQKFLEEESGAAVAFGTLTLFTSSEDSHYALTCYHVGCDDDGIAFSKAFQHNPVTVVQRYTSNSENNNYVMQNSLFYYHYQRDDHPVLDCADGNNDIADENCDSGDGNHDNGDGIHDNGDGNQDNGDGSHDNGDGNQDNGDGNHDNGDGNHDNGDRIHDNGDGNQDNGDGSHDNGDGSQDNGDGSHDNGDGNHENGDGNHDNGDVNHDNGDGNQDNGDGSHDNGDGNHDNSDGNHDNGDESHDNGDGNHDNGDGNHDNGDGNHDNGDGIYDYADENQNSVEENQIDPNNNSVAAEVDRVFLGKFSKGSFTEDCDIMSIEICDGLELNCPVIEAKFPINRKNMRDEFRRHQSRKNRVEVEHDGYKSGKTYGYLVDFDFNYRVSTKLLFRNAYVIKGVDDDSFLKPADSGALVSFHAEDGQKYAFAYGVCEVDGLRLPENDYTESNDDSSDESSVWSSDGNDDENEPSGVTRNDNTKTTREMDSSGTIAPLYICHDLDVALEILGLPHTPI